MDKKVLILCTGNSCRSIIAQALIDAKIDGVEAKSAGVKASGIVNPNAKKLLKEKEIWSDKYYSKTIDEVIEEEFDLIVTVCDHAYQTCPVFPKIVPKIHQSFEDPDGKDFDAFIKTYNDIKNTLLPQICITLGL